MATEKNLVEFRKSHPIDFKLLDQDEQAVLYISEDKDDWKLHLTIANTSSQAITMVDGQGGVSSDKHHHFALLFRPGTLSKRTLDLLGSDDYARVLRTADWEIAQIGQPATNETESNKLVTLFLLYQGANKTLAVGETRTIEFSGISAAPGSGSRGTQVELIPHQLQFASDNTPITASRTQYMHVTNHSGRKNIPLHVAVVDGNRVLNGATDATITLRMTNVCRNKDGGTSSHISFRGPNSKTGEPQTKLVVSYDKGSEEWDLGDADAKVTATWKDKEGQDKTVDGTSIGKLSEQPAWEIIFPDDIDLVLNASINVTITGLKVASNAGHANVYLHYENIPGYWDGQFVCSVEKGPIVVKDGNVGIGLANPGAAKLAVDGKLAVNGSLTVTGPSDLLGTPVLKVEGWTHLQVDKEQFLFLRDIPKVYDAQGGIHLFTSKSKLLVAQNFDQKGQPVPLPEIHLVADKVGIGTTAPSAKLEIGGDVKMSFGPGAEGLHFMRNNNGNPGIFVTGTYGANAGLTIANVDGGNIAMINLCAEKVMVKNLETSGVIVGVQRTKDEWDSSYPKLKNATYWEGEVNASKISEFSVALSGKGATPAIIAGSGIPQKGGESCQYHYAIVGSKPTMINLNSGEAKTFIIDHPVEKEKYLVHATLEGPEAAVYYRGTARLYAGKAVIEMPAYFEALTRREGRTILLTNLDGFDQLAVQTQDGEKIKHGKFVVISRDPASNQAFDWEVKAVRRDAGDLDVEPNKSDLGVERFGPYTYGVPRKNVH